MEYRYVVCISIKKTLILYAIDPWSIQVEPVTTVLGYFVCEKLLPIHMLTNKIDMTFTWSNDIQILIALN